MAKLQKGDLDQLTTDDLILIEKESILGVLPSIRTPAGLRFRKVLDGQVRDIRKRGRIPDLPVEWAGGGEVPTSPPVAIRQARRKGEVEVSNLERSIREGAAESCCGENCGVERDPPEEEEKLREAVKNVYGEDDPAR